MALELHQEQSKEVLGYPVLFLNVPTTYQRVVYVQIFRVYLAEIVCGDFQQENLEYSHQSLQFEPLSPPRDTLQYIYCR